MKGFNLQAGLFIAAVLASSAVLSGLNVHGWFGTAQAFAASPQEKGQARNELDQVITSLSRVDAAYALGNAADSQTKFEEARSSWNNILPALSARERAGHKTCSTLWRPS
jgi:hypothetical protein